MPVIPSVLLPYIPRPEYPWYFSRLSPVMWAASMMRLMALTFMTRIPGLVVVSSCRLFYHQPTGTGITNSIAPVSKSCVIDSRC